MVKKTLLLCLLFLFCIIAIPVQSQATPVPTLPPRAINPTTLADCGLPATYAGFNSASNITTFNLTADCYFHNWTVQSGWPFLRFESGEFTINGNGHSIIGSNNHYAIIVGLPTSNTNTVLHLNDITIRNAGIENQPQQAVIVQRGARLNGRNIIFRNNVGAGGALHAALGGKAYLENAQFLNNRKTHGLVGYGTAASLVGTGPAADTVMSINGGIFEGNTTVLATDRVISVSGSTLQLSGCVIFRNNVGVHWVTLLGGIVSDNSINQDDRTRCPKPKRKQEKIPTATATLRPLATTCIDLNQATGIAVRATYGLASGVQCQRLDGGGIGVQAIVDGGFIDAVDVWGYVEQGVEVCFPQAGELLFLDARTMPRAIAPLASTVVDGMTCGAVETPGSIVLMPLP